MRITLPTLALSSLLLMVSSAGQSQADLKSHNPRSLALTEAGDAALAQPDRASEAADDFETALVLDPQNRAALIGLARTAMVQGLPGKAIHYYRAALALAPNDVAVLAGQGEAMVAKGAFAKANENLAKIKTLCVTACPEQLALSSAITKGNEVPTLSAAQIQSKPVVSDDVSKTN
jgi:Tfp pilus assembly protein PilF